MSTHYNAFISYRHAPRDMKVAEAIQKDLESFHIPKKFRDEAGTKSFHIFRDKNELGTASDLSTEISNALDNSDFLIVICSTSVKESIWVTREITYFLKHHPRSHVLTVLADGEPEEIIPDIITREERIMQDERGNYYTTTVPLEPLSCDYRLPHHKAKRIELPRLTSALLHCSYDDLMNRKRKARVRNVTLGFSAALIFMASLGVYMFLSKQKIEKNLEDSLRNQSIYLATASEEQMEAQDRVLAVQLALAALPKDEEDKRPLTTQAIHALANATLAYHSNTNGDIFNEWNYPMQDSVKEFCISPTDGQLAAIDNSGHLVVWDTATHKTLMATEIKDGDVHDILFLDDNSLIVGKSREIISYNPETGNEIWKYTLSDGFFPETEMIIRKGENGESIFALDNDYKVLEINGKNGEVIHEYQIPKKDGEDDLTISRFALSPSGNKIAFSGSAGISFGDMYILGVYDLSDGSVKLTPKGAARYRSFLWVSEDRLLAAWPTDTLGASWSVGDISTIKKDHTMIACFDVATLSSVWEYDHVTTDVYIQGGFYAMSDGEAVAYYAANRSVIFNPEDGSVIHDHMLNDPIVEIFDPSGKGVPYYITQEGNLVYSSAKDDTLSVIPCLNPRLNAAEFRRGIYTKQNNGSEIYFFGVDVWDTNWTPVENGPEITTYTSGLYLDSSIFAILSQENAEDVKDSVRGAEEYEGDITILTLIRPLDNKLIDRIILSEEEVLFSGYKLLGSAAGHFYVAVDSVKNGYKLMSIDMGTGEISSTQISDSYLSNNVGDKLVGGKLVYVDQDEEFRVRVNLYDVATGNTESKLLSEEPGSIYLHKAPIYIESAKTVYLCGSEMDWKVSFEDMSRPTDSLGWIPGWQKTKFVAYDYNSGKYAISDDEMILILNSDFTEAARISCSSSSPIGLCFMGAKDKKEASTLLVPCENACLYRYNSETGEFLGRTGYSRAVSSSLGVNFVFSLDASTLYLLQSSGMSMIDTKDYVEIAYIPSCAGYVPLTDRIYTSSYVNGGSYSYGYFPRYTVDDLVKKAEDLLQGAEMSDEVKSEYGLDEN